MTYQTDFTRGQNQYDLSRSMLAQNLQPQQNQNIGTAVARILAAYFNSKGMNTGQMGMETAGNAKRDQGKIELAKMLGAYRGDTPYQQPAGQTFPGEAPIPGLMNQGTGQNRDALMQAMVGSSQPSIQSAGLQQLLAVPKPKSMERELYEQWKMQNPTGTVGDFLAAKKSSITVNNNQLPKLGPDQQFIDINDPMKGVEIIPNSPTDLKRRADAADAAGAERKTEQELFAQQMANDEFLGQIDKALDNNTFFTSGMLGKIATLWPSSDAAYQELILQRIQGEVALNRLAQAQAASKTGGVFGSLQKAELDLLKNSISALKVGMSQDRMKEGLLEIKEHTLKWEGYQELWDKDGFGGFGKYVEGQGVEVLDKQDNVMGYYN